MVRRPVCLCVKHPSGAQDRIFITARQLRVCWREAPSLTRGRVCRLQLLLALASVVIFTTYKLWWPFCFLSFNTILVMARARVTLRLTVYRHSVRFAPSALRLSTRYWTLAVIVLMQQTSFLNRGWGCFLWIGFVFVKCTYRTYSMLLKILPCALYTSLLSVQALQSRSCLSYLSYATTTA
jgi:hypothetical protein